MRVGSQLDYQERLSLFIGILKANNQNMEEACKMLKTKKKNNFNEVYIDPYGIEFHVHPLRLGNERITPLEELEQIYGCDAEELFDEETKCVDPLNVFFYNTDLSEEDTKYLQSLEEEFEEAKDELAERSQAWQLGQPAHLLQELLDKVKAVHVKYEELKKKYNYEGI